MEAVTMAHPVFGPIYARILSLCSEFLPFSAPWDFIQAGSNVRGPVADSSAAVAELHRDYSSQELLDAGVVLPDATESPRLAPGLTRPGGAVIAIHGADPGVPAALLTDKGCVPDTRLALEWSLEDPATVAGVRDHGCVYAAGSVRDAALLAALGLPATVGCGLERMSPWLRAGHLSREVAPDPDPTGASAGPQRPPLTCLVAWSVEDLEIEVPEPIGAAIKYLRSARTHVGLPVDRFRVWEPSFIDLESWRFALGLRNPEMFGEWLAARLRDGSELGALDEGVGAREPEYVETLAEFVHELTEADRPNFGLEKARNAHHRSINQELVEPLLRWGLTGGPTVKTAAVHVAHAARILHSITPLLTALLARADNEVRAGLPPIAPNVLSQYVTVSKGFERGIRTLLRAMEVDQCDL
jgi:hypothetical protein